jgi:hypothetical protein
MINVRAKTVGRGGKKKEIEGIDKEAKKKLMKDRQILKDEGI